jgi:GT2 family glycosyltransferase
MTAVSSREASVPPEVPQPGLPSLSVIIPVYNAGLALGVQLAALVSQRYTRPWEALVIDNGSTDGSGRLAQRFGSRLPGLRVITDDRGKGPAYARNRGAALATGDSLIFLDQDDKAADGYLEAMGRALAEHDLVGARIDHDGLNPTSLHHARFRWQSDDVMRGNFLPATSGCAMGIRRAVFQDLGGFDERFLYAQDIDLCWRAQLAGHDLAFVPDAVLAYRYRMSALDHVRQEYRWGTDDALIYRTFRPSGMPRRRVRRAASEWRQIARAVPQVSTPADARRIVGQAARRLGHLRGSVLHRVWFP